ncbi:hypothetical protein ABK040_001729 [Willaertia magna]
MNTHKGFTWGFVDTSKASGCFKFDSSLPTPTINKTNDLLINVKVISLNPVDYKLPTYLSLFSVILKNRKLVGGNDFADEVLGMKFGPPSGAFQQFILANTNKFGNVIVKKPKELSLEQAAATPTCLLTNYTAMSKVKDLSNCEVFINGASGGTGSFGILMAKYYYNSKKVYGTCSTRNVSYVSSLGCDKVIDYTKENWQEELNKHVSDKKDLVLFDYVGNYEMLKYAIKNKTKSFISIIPDRTTTSFATVKYLSLLYWNRLLYKLSLSSTDTQIINVEFNSEKLQELINWYGENGFQNRVNLTIHSLDEFSEAMDKLSSHRTTGKIVVGMEEK